MRELKFDVIFWDGSDPKTIEHLTLEEAVREDYVKFHPLEGHDECIIIRQFTGLTDKNGKDIYEGDITNEGVVKWFNDLHWDGGGSRHSGFYFDISYMAAMDNELEYHVGFDKNIEVLGNIWENPELVK